MFSGSSKLRRSPKRVEAPDDVLEAPGRRPAEAVDGVEPEDAETDVAGLVDVRMPQPREALDRRRAEVVVLRH